MNATPFPHNHSRNTTVSAFKAPPKNTPARTHKETVKIKLWMQTPVCSQTQNTHMYKRLIYQRGQTFRNEHWNSRSQQAGSLWLNLFLCGVSVTEAELIQLAMEVWQTQPRTLCCSVPVPPPPHVCIPSIAMALMAKHVWKWQQDTALKGTWFKIFSQICKVNLSSHECKNSGGYFLTYMEKHEYNSWTGGQWCAQTLYGAKKKGKSFRCRIMERGFYFLPWGHTRTVLGVTRRVLGST